jgi:hypothetical protein
MERLSIRQGEMQAACQTIEGEKPLRQKNLLSIALFNIQTTLPGFGFHCPTPDTHLLALTFPNTCSFAVSPRPDGRGDTDVFLPFLIL